MTFKHCSSCQTNTGWKRHFGFGTMVACLITSGAWLLALPFYPKRCMRCGMSDADGRKMTGGWTLGARLGLGFILLVALSPMFIDSTPSQGTLKSTAGGAAPSAARVSSKPGHNPHVKIDDAGPAEFRWTACSTNPKSVMGRIPSGTTVRVLEAEECEMSPFLTVTFYKVDWEGGVWISSALTDTPKVSARTRR